MKSYAPGIVLIVIILLIDLYTFKGLRLLTSNIQASWIRWTIHSIYWLVTALAIAATVWLSVNITEVQDTRDYRTFFTLAGLLMLVIAPKLIFMAFHLMDDIYFLVQKIWSSWSGSSASDSASSNTITRSKFLTQIGLALAALPFFGMIYGMLKGRFDFRVINQKVNFSHLPEAFEGFRIVQISDAHLGSFYHNYAAVAEVFDMVNNLRPDLIVFSGDMVNNYADEVDGWEPYFSKLNAPFGKYAILGNHDYGDYVSWPSKAAKEANLRELVEKVESTGFKMLLNSNVTISKAGEEISLIGVENWGHGRFSKYGDLEQAMRGANPPFKILLSHDPSHWDEQVIRKTDIALTMSGHTHGMQFGIEVPGIKWSPAQYRYPRWGGLYKAGNQQLYVNRGFGYIGFPGRVGISPEITLIELNKA